MASLPCIILKTMQDTWTKMIREISQPIPNKKRGKNSEKVCKIFCMQKKRTIPLRKMASARMVCSSQAVSGDSAPRVEISPSSAP